MSLSFLPALKKFVSLSNSCEFEAISMVFKGQPVLEFRSAYVYVCAITRVSYT